MRCDGTSIFYYKYRENVNNHSGGLSPKTPGLSQKLQNWVFKIKTGVLLTLYLSIIYGLYIRVNLRNLGSKMKKHTFMELDLNILVTDEVNEQRKRIIMRYQA